jgi:trimeric autotransporter adhesin
LKRLLLCLVIVYVLLASSVSALAQAPNISYGTPTNVYTVGTAIAPLTPVNSGAAVPATTYGQVTTLVASGVGAPKLANPQAITTDGAGNVYVADYGNNLIRKITPAGVMTTLAGSGAAAELDNTGAAAKFNGPDGIAYDGVANLYVSDAGGHVIRKIVIATGVVTTYAGIAGSSGTTNGTLLTSKFNAPAGLSIDAAGNIYIADQGNNLIRMIAGGTVSTLAGSGAVGAANGIGVAASFNAPNDLVADQSGNVFVADYLNNLIRKIVVSTGAVGTFAGSTAGYTDATGLAAKFGNLSSIGIDASGNLLVADLGNQRIRLVTPGAVVTTIAGSGGAETDGTGVLAGFSNPGGIEVDNQGNCYITDFPTVTTGTVRKMLLTGYTISPALPAGLTFTVTTGVISGNPTAISAATNYTITGYNASGSSSTVVSIACGQTVAWTSGGNTTAWITGANWSTGVQPGVNDAVSIGVAAYIKANEPSITAANVTVNSITFGSAHNGTLTVGTGIILTVNNNLTVNTGASPVLTGAGTGAVNMAPGSIVNINGTGKLTITSPLNFTLQSDPTGSASIGQITATSITGTGAGLINVERYLTGGSLTYRGYRLLSSPVYAGAANGNNIYSINYLKNSIYLTATTTAGGFDNIVAANPTLFLYRENMTPLNTTFTNGNFRGINNINASPSYTIDSDGAPFNIPVGSGFLCFFRGNKASGSFATETVGGYVPQAVTLTTRGTLNAGQIPVKDWFTPLVATLSYTPASPAAVRGYNLVGNPYASSIDWDTFQTVTTTLNIYGSNISSTIWVLDPVSKNYGAYTSGTVGGLGTNNSSHIIASGQGFFVVATAAAPKLNFNEGAKINAQVTSPKLLMGKPANLYANNQYLRLQLAKDIINTDDMLVSFNSSASTAYNPDIDAIYKPGYGAVSLASLTSDHVHTAIKVEPLPKTTEYMGLAVNTATDGTYTLNMKTIVGIPQLFDIWLIDAYKKDSLDMRHNKTYTFDVLKSDTNTFGTGRFTLVIRQNAAFAYRLLDFTASKVSASTPQVEVVWSTENEQNYTDFTLERSINNGKTFNVLDGKQSSAQGTYSFLDKNPINGQNLYRLKQEDINGKITYSGVIPVGFATMSINRVKSNINVYPNPAVSTINLAIAEGINTSAIYNIQITNSSGMVIKQATSGQPNWQTSINDLQPGTYLVKVLNNKDKSLVGNTKFIKL